MVQQSQFSSYLRNSLTSCNKNVNKLCPQINAVVHLSAALSQRVLSQAAMHYMQLGILRVLNVNPFEFIKLDVREVYPLPMRLKLCEDTT